MPINLRILFSRLFIHSQFWVALMAFSLTLLTLFELKSDSFLISVSVALITWGGYAYIRSFNHSSSPNHHHYSALKWFYIPVAMVSLSIGVYWMYQMSNSLRIHVVSLSLPALLVFLYPLQFSRLSIRQLPGLKLTIICLCWVWLTTIIPSIFSKEVNFYPLFIMSLQRFLFLLVWTLPFDIRDVDNDTKLLKTIPQMMGITHTKRMLYVLIFILQVSYLLTAWIGNTHTALAISYILALEVLVVLVYFSRKSVDRGYYSVLVESVPLLALLFTVITALMMY